MSKPPRIVIFIGSIPTLQSAITISGDDGARIKIDIPETHITAIDALRTMRGKALRVTIETLDDDE